ncbi:MAG: flagellar hook-basal body protein [Deltaproteobacteria bacterium]|nr:flagellar hook-basal body protein [Deltaproteobacteria bacterium]
MRPQASFPLVSYGKALERQMEAISNNLANIDTNGYKQDQPSFQAVFAQTMGTPNMSDEEGFFDMEHLPPYSGVGQSFVTVADMGKDYTPGRLVTTNNQLDFALPDKESFFSVNTPQGERYTRAGAFRLNPDNKLVTVEGFQVNGKDGPITLDGQDIQVSEDGLFTVDGKKMGGFKIVTFPNPDRLQKLGYGLFAPVDEANPARVQETVKVMQGVTESSNVNAMKEMAKMIEANHAYTAMQKAIGSEDDMNKKAISLAQV